MNIQATIGTESHSTSSGWAKLKINGRDVTYRDAFSKNWVSKFGDKHASWCDCFFEVKPGDKIEFVAGTNSGNRGANRDRIHQIFVADESLEVLEIKPLGYPASEAGISGRLRLEKDLIADASSEVNRPKL